MNNYNYKWVVVGLLWFTCFFNYADRQGIFSVFPLLETEMGLSKVQLGFVASAFMWVYAGTGWFAGLMGDRYNRKWVIIAGFAFWSLVTLALGFAKDYSHLVFLRAIEGFGEAFYFPAAMSMISSYHGPDTRSRAMGIHQSSVYIGTIAGGTVSGWMADHYGWRSSFYVFGLSGMVLAFLLILLLREPVRQESELVSPHAAPEKNESLLNTFIGMLGLFRIPMVLILIAVFIGANFVAAIFLTWTPNFLYDKFKLSLTMAGFNATAFSQIGSVLGVLVGGYMADRMIRKHLGGRMLTQSFGLIAGVPFIFVVGWTLQMPILLSALFLFGIFKGIYDANIWASLHDVVPPERRASAVGMMNSLGWFSGGIAATFTGWASQRYSMSACLSATSAIYFFFGLLLIFGVMVFMRGRQPVVQEEEEARA